MPLNADDIREIFLAGRKITIDTESHGPIELRDLSFENMWWLKDEKTKALPIREFIAHLVQMHIVSPELDIETVQDWQDDLLSFVACAWWRQQDLSENFSSDTLTFEDFHKVVYDYSNKFHNELEKTGKFLSSITLPNLQIFTAQNLLASNILSTSKFTEAYKANISSAFDAMQQFVERNTAMVNLLNQRMATFTNLVTNTLNNTIKDFSPPNVVFPTIDTSQFFAALPDFTELKEAFEEIRKGEETLRETGYGFLYAKSSIRFVRQFADVDPKELQALITDKFVQETQEMKFQEELHTLFQQSSVLRSRWEIIIQALGAHRRKEYFLSIPALLPQVEGIIGDMLVLRNFVEKQGHKLYKKENGKIKLNDKGNQVEARGLKNLIDHSHLKDDPDLRAVADFITERLLGDRNGVLHGRSVDYGTARLSVQALLVIREIAKVLVDLENGHSQKVEE